MPQPNAAAVSADADSPFRATSPNQLRDQGDDQAVRQDMTRTGKTLKSGVDAKVASQKGVEARRRIAAERAAARSSAPPARSDRAQQDAAIEHQLATKAAAGDVQAARTLLDWRSRSSASALEGDAWLDLLTASERHTVATLIDRAERRSRGEDVAEEEEREEPDPARDELLWR